MVVNITYETLFELLRNERNKEDLQTLDKDFFKHVEVYLSEKKSIAVDKGKEGLFGADERATTLRQLDSIKKVLNELYQTRERKIINLALHKSRTRSDNSDTTMLLREEEKFYKGLVELLNVYREGIVKRLLNFESVNLFEKKEISQKLCSNKLIRFKAAVPSFIDPNLQTHGPFQEEDIASLPSRVAEAIISKGKGEEIRIDRKLD